MRYRIKDTPQNQQRGIAFCLVLHMESVEESGQMRVLLEDSLEGGPSGPSLVAAKDIVPDTVGTDNQVP